FCLLKMCGGVLDLHSFPTRRSSDLFIDFGLVKAGSVTSSSAAGAGSFSAAVMRADHAASVVGRLVKSLRMPSRSQRPMTLVRGRDRKSTRLNSSHVKISYAVFCLKK